MKKQKKKTAQEKIDYDLMEEKRKSMMEAPHGVNMNTPGGEYDDGVAQRIGRDSIMGKLDPDKNVG